MKIKYNIIIKVNLPIQYDKITDSSLPKLWKQFSTLTLVSFQLLVSNVYIQNMTNINRETEKGRERESNERGKDS